MIGTMIRPAATSGKRLLTVQHRRAMATATEALAAKNSGKKGGLWIWEYYQRNLTKRPLLTKAIMASFIFFASDSATQCILPGNANWKESEVPGGSRVWRWDPSRALSGAGFGVVATTWLHYWWSFLEVQVGRVLPLQRYRLANALTKVVLDQAIGAPCYIYSYYVLTNFLQDLQDGRVPALQSWAENNEKASEMLWPTMLQHWKVWPLVHSFNFYFTPLHHRVLVQNLVLVGWSGYLSHLNHSKLMTPDEEIKVEIVRRETEIRLQEKELEQKKAEAQ